MKKILIIVLFFTSHLLVSQTYTGSSGVINDMSINDFPLLVSGLSPAIIDTGTFGLETICLSLTHANDSDLEISIVAPDGTIRILASGLGGGGNNYTSTCFNNSSSIFITSGSPPFTGTFIPQGYIESINNQQNGNGIWILRIRDLAPQNVGNLLSWSITFGNNPAQYFTFHDSNLPIVIINTNNQSIPDEPKITVDMGIIYNGIGNRNYITDPWNSYNGKIGIEVRGSSSQWFPKKGYGFECQDVNGFAIDSSILGMPKESDWILSASYSDKSMMNNPLTYSLSRKLGWYAPRSMYVELVVNGEYKGVFALMEKIKRNNDRVDISKLLQTDIFGDDLTGGYIFKIDKTTGNGGGGWTSNYAPQVSPSGQTIYFQYEYPSDITIVPQQMAYIQAYVDSFETALAGPNFMDTVIGYSKYINVNSLIDYFLLNELSRNVDGYRLSTYLYKTKYSNGGKLVMGPPWDYDLGYGNANYCDGSNVTGWAYQFGNVCGGDFWQNPFWWDRLMLDSNFTSKLRCRWEEVSQTVLSVNYLNAWCDSIGTLLCEGNHRNFSTWPTIGTYVWPNPAPFPTTYQGEVNEIKNWIVARWNWLNNNIPGNLINCNPTAITENVFGNNLSFAYPNPFLSNVHLSIYQREPSAVKMELLNSLGQTVQPIQTTLHGGGTETITFTPQLNLPAGIYLLRIVAGSNTWTQQLSKIE